jgi:hypothetical protein
VKKYTINQITEAFGNSYLNNLRTYRDAGVGPDDYPISIKNCLQALDKAI